MAIQLSESERDAWRTIEAYTEALQRKDWEAFFSHFHDDFVGWTILRPTPNGKAQRQKWVPFMYLNAEIVQYELEPYSVKVHGNVAICHYMAIKAKKHANGSHSLEKEKWSDVLIKENGRWLLVSDSGGPFE